MSDLKNIIKHYLPKVLRTVLYRVGCILLFFLSILWSVWCMWWLYGLFPFEIRAIISNFYDWIRSTGVVSEKTPVLSKNLGDFSPFANAILGGVIAAGFTAIINNKMNKRSSYINTVTAERVKWLGILRENFADFESQVIHVSIIKDCLESDEKSKEKKLREYKKLERIAVLLRLRLNPIDDEDLIHSIRAIVHDLFNDKADKAVEQLGTLGNAVAEMLKKEWDKVKDESESGRIS